MTNVASTAMPTPRPKPLLDRSNNHQRPMDSAARVRDSCMLLAKSIFCRAMVKEHRSRYGVKFCNQSINLRRPRDCLLLCSGGWVGRCLFVSLHSVRFGQLLLCAHKRIVNNNESVHRKEQQTSGINRIP